MKTFVPLLFVVPVAVFIAAEPANTATVPGASGVLNHDVPMHLTKVADSPQWCLRCRLGGIRHPYPPPPPGYGNRPMSAPTPTSPAGAAAAAPAADVKDGTPSIDLPWWLQW